MRSRQLSITIVALAALGGAAGCGSSSSHQSPPSSGKATLSGAAPPELVGTFKTTLTRRDAARAPRPNELPTGSWTLVIGNSGGPNNSRALGVGNGDTDRVVYRFGVKGSSLAIGCISDQGLPAQGSQTYAWSMHGDALTLSARSPRCPHGDPNNQLILTSHPWAKQPAH